MNKLIYLLFIFVFWGCAQKIDTEIHHKKRDNVLNVRDKIKEIDTGDIFLSNFSQPYILNDYLIVSDYKSFDKLIYIFDKNSFKYLTSTAERGKGPGEIASIGSLAVDEGNRIFYAIDHGKYRIFSFNLDSIFANPDYLPEEKIVMNEDLYPSYYFLKNDTIAVGKFSRQIGSSNYKPVVAKWNLKTGEIQLMEYTGHPEIKRKRTDFAVSFENDIYVECYWHHDLMTIGSLTDGFKCNIYGRKWNNKHSNKDLYYGHVIITEDRIIAAYLGGDNFYKKENGGIGANYPTKFLVFDLNGNYIQTLDIGYAIIEICYDRENRRIIMILDDEKLFSYLDLEGILE